MNKKASALILSVVMLLSMVAPAGTVAADSSAVDSSSSSDEFIELDDDRSLWEEAPLTLRIDDPIGATELLKPETTLSGDAVPRDDVLLDRNPLAVYNQGDTLELSFSPTTSPDDADSFDLVVGYVSDSDEVAMPSNLDISALDEFLTDENVEFDRLDDDLSGSSFDVSYDAAEPGLYTFVLVEEGEFDTTDGNLDGEGTIYGIDAAPVQTAPSESLDLQTESPVIGDDLEFDVEAGFDADDGAVDHVVAVFDEDAVAAEKQEIIIDELNSETSADDFEVRTSIESVDGVAETEAVTVFGQQIGERSIAGPTTPGDLISFFGTDLETTTTDNATILNASMTAVSDRNTTETVTVEHSIVGSREPTTSSTLRLVTTKQRCRR